MIVSDEDGEPGTVDQKPRWEGPPETRPRGYRPAKDDPAKDPDAAGETLENPERDDIGGSVVDTRTANG